MILFCRPDSQNPVIGLFLWYLSERQYLRKRAARGMRGSAFLPVYAISCVCMPVIRVPMRTWQPRAQALRTISPLRVVIYADAHKLSRREQEVLTLVLKGNDAQNIASELVIKPWHGQCTLASHLR